MPKKLENCVRDVKATGKPASSAWPICIKSTGLHPHHEGAKAGHGPKTKPQVRR